MTVFGHCRDTVRNPIDVLFDGDDHVREYRWASRSRYGEEIRESGNAEAQIGSGSGRPFFLQSQSLAAADVHGEQGPGHCVESGGENDGVEFVFSTSGLNSLFRDAVDWLFADVDENDIRAVEGLKVSGVEAQALATENRIWTKFLGSIRVLDQVANFSPDELSRGGIGFEVEA